MAGLLPLEAPIPVHRVAWSRLLKSLRGPHRFRLLILTYGDSSYRDRLIEHLVTQLDADSHQRLAVRKDEAPRDFEQRLIEAAKRARHLTVVGFDELEERRDDWFTTFNYAREHLAEHCPATLLFWMHDEDANALAHTAPDLWAWRTGVYEFSGPLTGRFESSAEGVRRMLDWEERRPPLEKTAPPTSDTAAAAQRLWELLEVRLRAADDDDEHDRARLYLQAGKLRDALGETESARDHLERAIAAYGALADEAEQLTARVQLLNLEKSAGNFDAVESGLRELLSRAALPDQVRAVGLMGLAGLRESQGDSEAAKAILEEQVLPLVKRVGDRSTAAMAHRQLASVLRVRGELDRALDLYRSVVLPGFEQLGDTRSVALTYRAIAELLTGRGDVQGALQLHREQELPLLERVADERELAQTHGAIAACLDELGRSDEALKVMTEHCIPRLQALGDPLELARTWERFAEMLERRGALEEALRLRRQVVPVLLNESLESVAASGSTRVEVALHHDSVKWELAINSAAIGLTLLQRGQPEDVPEAVTLMTDLAQRLRAGGDDARARRIEALQQTALAAYSSVAKSGSEPSS